jgi:hypothetical protein
MGRCEKRIAPITQDALTASSIRDILGISMMRRFASRMKTTLKNGYIRFDMVPHKKSNSRSHSDVCKSLR